MRKFIVRYRINRSWGDSVAEALWWSLRGKAFPELLNLDLDSDNYIMIGDK